MEELLLLTGLATGIRDAMDAFLEMLELLVGAFVVCCLIGWFLIFIREKIYEIKKRREPAETVGIQDVSTDNEADYIRKHCLRMYSLAECEVLYNSETSELISIDRQNENINRAYVDKVTFKKYRQHINSSRCFISCGSLYYTMLINLGEEQGYRFEIRKISDSIEERERNNYFIGVIINGQYYHIYDKDNKYVTYSVENGSISTLYFDCQGEPKIKEHMISKYISKYHNYIIQQGNILKGTDEEGNNVILFKSMNNVDSRIITRVMRDMIKEKLYMDNVIKIYDVLGSIYYECPTYEKALEIMEEIEERCDLRTQQKA